jgi:glutaminyl-peptide cyclotransferase
MKKVILFCAALGAISLGFWACGTGEIKPPVAEQPTIAVPQFNADSAYLFTEQQVAFGPRVTGSEPHKKCVAWYVTQFKKYGCEVIEQPFDAKVYTGEVKKATNIIAQINPEATHRIYISAHFDSRNQAEEDKDPAKQKQPILGADDGASGVGMMIELARTLQKNPAPKDLGIDFVLFDAEDLGKNEDETAKSWGLGSQHWAANPHSKSYQPRYGILLDMVGAKNAVFPKEECSQQYAADIHNKIWQIANDAGYGNFFLDKKCRAVIDDHYFVNTIAHIPTVDIINLDISQGDGGYKFGAYHHTHDDNMSIIDKTTLKAVGQTVLTVIFREAAMPL